MPLSHPAHRSDTAVPAPAPKFWLVVTPAPHCHAAAPVIYSLSESPVRSLFLQHSGGVRSINVVPDLRRLRKPHSQVAPLEIHLADYGNLTPALRAMSTPFWCAGIFALLRSHFTESPCRVRSHWNPLQMSGSSLIRPLPVTFPESHSCWGS